MTFNDALDHIGLDRRVCRPGSWPKKLSTRNFRMNPEIFAASVRVLNPREQFGGLQLPNWTLQRFRTKRRPKIRTDFSKFGLCERSQMNRQLSIYSRAGIRLKVRNENEFKNKRNQYSLPVHFKIVFWLRVYGGGLAWRCADLLLMWLEHTNTSRAWPGSAFYRQHNRVLVASRCVLNILHPNDRQHDNAIAHTPARRSWCKPLRPAGRFYGLARFHIELNFESESFWRTDEGLKRA